MGSFPGAGPRRATLGTARKCVTKVDVFHVAEQPGSHLLFVSDVGGICGVLRVHGFSYTASPFFLACSSCAVDGLAVLFTTGCFSSVALQPCCLC